MRSERESILHNGNEVARVIRSHSISGLEFFTDNETYLQVGVHNKAAGVEVIPHAHRCNPFLVDRMEEVFFIIKGRVLVTIYEQTSGSIIQEVTLNKGDTMIHFSQGHGLTFLKPTILFEVKQGPFKGTKNSKIYFREKESVVA